CLNLVRLGFEAPRPDGAAAAADWLKGLKSKEAWVRLRAIEVVGDLGPVASEAISALKGALEDGDEGGRCVASVALPKMLAEEVLPSLRKLKDKDPNVRGAVHNALALHGRDAKVVAPALIELLNDREVEVRRSAVSLLGVMDLEAMMVVPELIK